MATTRAPSLAIAGTKSSCSPRVGENCGMFYDWCCVRPIQPTTTKGHSRDPEASPCLGWRQFKNAYSHQTHETCVFDLLPCWNKWDVRDALLGYHKRLDFFTVCWNGTLVFYQSYSSLWFVNVSIYVIVFQRFARDGDYKKWASSSVLCWHQSSFISPMMPNAMQQNLMRICLIICQHCRGDWTGMNVTLLILLYELSKGGTYYLTNH